MEKENQNLENMEQQEKISRILLLLQTFSSSLEKACDGKKSTNDISEERFIWETINKVFVILISCENSLTAKDSLLAHLIARYTYEMLIVFIYIFDDKEKRQEKISKFLTFNQFTNTDRKWINKTYTEMLEDIPDHVYFDTHKDHYRHLSNFAHPTMDSFLLNRRGQQSEFSLISSTVLLTMRTIIEIINICFENNLYFDEVHKNMLDVNTYLLQIDKLMKK